MQWYVRCWPFSDMARQMMKDRFEARSGHRMLAVVSKKKQNTVSSQSQNGLTKELPFSGDTPQRAYFFCQPGRWRDRVDVHEDGRIGVIGRMPTDEEWAARYGGGGEPVLVVDNSS
jgi:hypothetical protein